MDYNQSYKKNKKLVKDLNLHFHYNAFLEREGEIDGIWLASFEYKVEPQFHSTGETINAVVHEIKEKINNWFKKKKKNLDFETLMVYYNIEAGKEDFMDIKIGGKNFPVQTKGTQ